MKKISALLVLFVLVISAAFSVSAEIPYQTYTYSYQGVLQVSAHAYVPEQSVSLAGTEIGELSSPRDIFAHGDKVYVADTGNSRIVILNGDMTVHHVIDTFGEGDTFNKPQGVFVAKTGEIYVADTQNSRIVCFNPDYSLQTVINKPESKLVDADLVYRPIGVAVDDSERLYVVSANLNLGIMIIDKNEKFYGYIGAQKVTVSLIDLFWRNFMTEEQIKRTKTNVPTEYNNIVIDDEGFLFVTTNAIDKHTQYNAAISKSRSADHCPIKKLNAKGDDILPRNGFYPPAGDLEVEFGFGAQFGPSSIAETALGQNGVFSLVDISKNKIFTYDEDGKLLYAFGGTGSEIGLFQSLTGATYLGSDLLCLDQETGRITVFKRTEYGDKIDAAIAAYNDKRFAESSELWADLVNDNNNLDLAYIGLADACYRNGDYEEAMTYYQKTTNIEGYSKAYAAYRKQWLEKWFLLVLAIAAAAIAAVAVVWKFIAKRNRAGDLQSTGYSTGQRLLYAGHLIFHPFSASDEIKRRGRGSVLSATILLLLAVLANLFKETVSGYIFIGESQSTFSLSVSAMSLIIPVFLWCAASWCLTSLMDGEGSFKDIYISTCTALTPMILLYFPLSLVSNFFTSDEAAFYTFFTTLAVGWVLFLIFFGTLTIHDYSLSKTIVMVILGVIGMMILIFLGVLFFNLLQQMILFVSNIITEITYRL